MCDFVIINLDLLHMPVTLFMGVYYIKIYI